MAIKLNTKALDFAHELMKTHKVDHHYGQGKESMHGITQPETHEYLKNHTDHEYGLWFLGINTSAAQNSPEQYLYPYGDFQVIHRALVEKISKQAFKDHHHEIAQAAEELLKRIDKK